MNKKDMSKKNTSALKKTMLDKEAFLKKYNELRKTSSSLGASPEHEAFKEANSGNPFYQYVEE